MLKKFLPKSEFIKHFLTLLTGTSLAQLIPVFLSPVLTRLYAPTEFGTLAIYVSIFTLFSVIATFRYELAIVLPEREEDAVNIFALSFIITLFVSFFSLIIILLFNQQICDLFNNQSISIWLYFVPISVLLVGFYQTCNYWSNRNKRFKRMATSKIIQTSSANTTNVLLGFWKIIPNGLILGNIFGQVLATLYMGCRVWKYDKDKISLINKKKIIEQAKIYQDFPKINTFHSFMDKFRESSTIFVISYFFSATILGYYSFAMRIVMLPLSLISLSVSQVFYQQASKIYADTGNIQTLMKKMLIKFSLFVLPGFIIVVIFAQPISGFIFGNEWKEAGVYVQLMSPFLFFRFLISMIAPIPMIVEKQKPMFFITLIGNIIIILSFIYGGLIANDIKQGLIILSSLMIFYAIAVIFWLYKISKKATI